MNTYFWTRKQQMGKHKTHLKRLLKHEVIFTKPSLLSNLFTKTLTVILSMGYTVKTSQGLLWTHIQVLSTHLTETLFHCQHLYGNLQFNHHLELLAVAHKIWLLTSFLKCTKEGLLSQAHSITLTKCHIPISIQVGSKSINNTMLVDSLSPKLLLLRFCLPIIKASHNPSSSSSS